MKTGILITSISNFGEKGFYNSQEIGMAKALSRLAEQIVIYKLVPKEKEESSEEVEGYKNIIIRFIPAAGIGINGLMDTEKLDTDLDGLLHFSDTQLCVPRVYKWAQKHHVAYIPYIGVIESHSDQPVKRIVTNFLTKRNIGVYKKCSCLAKTPEVLKALSTFGIRDITVAPVGLDLSLLNAQYQSADREELKARYGFARGDKILLFVGRLSQEKQPLKMLDIFSEIIKTEPSYRLLMVGNGELQERVEHVIAGRKLETFVRRIERIPNSSIWELYHMAECFVNLNEQEIFGMSVLEAMYYGCKVVAYKAPGPCCVIEDGISGWLVHDEQTAIARILDQKSMGQEAHSRIVEHFSWENTAEIVEKMFAAAR